MYETPLKSSMRMATRSAVASTMAASVACEARPLVSSIVRNGIRLKRTPETGVNLFSIAQRQAPPFR
jgi:hypothetical protein